jgi:hypothetical protein
MKKTGLDRGMYFECGRICQAKSFGHLVDKVRWNFWDISDLLQGVELRYRFLYAKHKQA